MQQISFRSISDLDSGVANGIKRQLEGYRIDLECDACQKKNSAAVSNLLRNPSVYCQCGNQMRVDVNVVKDVLRLL